MITTSPFLHRVSPGGGFPGFHGTMRCSESRPPFPPHFVSFAWRYHLSACQFAPADGQAPSLPQAGTRWSPGRPWSGVFRWRRPGLPGSWGTPTHVPCSQTPTGPRRQATTTPRYGLPPFVRRRLPRLGSYGAQSHGPYIRCLRFAGWITPPPRKTRFWLLAKLCQAGLVTRRVPTKGFRMSHNMTSSFPRLSWRKRNEPKKPRSRP